jgi:uncharacterized damage-inducible protein DinB
MVPLEAIRDLIDYTAWASRRLVEAASQLPPAELTRDFGTADKSVLGTLVHAFAADRIWMRRVAGESPTAFISESDYQLSVLQQDWPALHGKWQKWAASLTDISVAQDIPYSDIRGNPYRQPAWQIAMHVVNHATHHRGQVSGFLRSMGHQPPPLDLTAFYRTRGIA